MIAPLVAEGTVGEVEEGISPSAEATPPMSEEASEQTLRIPSTMEGRSGVSKTSVWFVCVKQSTHWGNADWNVSVQAHLITSMKAPGLKMIIEKFANTGAACAQLSMLGYPWAQIGHDGG